MCLCTNVTKTNPCAFYILNNALDSDACFKQRQRAALSDTTYCRITQGTRATQSIRAHTYLSCLHRPQIHTNTRMYACIHQLPSHPSPAQCSSLTRALVWKNRGQTVKQLHWQLINQGVTAIQLPPGCSALQQTSEPRERAVFNSRCISACCIIAPCHVHSHPVFNR